MGRQGVVNEQRREIRLHRRIRLAPALGFACVHSLATVVPGLAPAHALAGVHAFAVMLGLHRVRGRTAGCLHACAGTTVAALTSCDRSRRPGKQTRHRRSGESPRYPRLSLHDRFLSYELRATFAPTTRPQVAPSLGNKPPTPSPYSIKVERTPARRTRLGSRKDDVASRLPLTTPQGRINSWMN